jgi:outer membrane lipoprotein-sorting protein
MMRGSISFLSVLLSFLALITFGQKKGEALSAAVMMEKVEKGFEGIKDFEVSIEATVDMERVRVPKMTGTLYFKRPDKIHFASANFMLLPREGIVVNPSVLRERYQPSLAGEEEIDGKKLFKLQLVAKTENIRPRQMQLWIDPARWTIARMETVPYQGRILRLTFDYELQGGKYWLPRTLSASFDVAVRDTSRQIELDVAAQPQFEQMRRPPRSGSITVTYSNYKVNTGLSDSIFERQQDPVKQ